MTEQAAIPTVEWLRVGPRVLVSSRLWCDPERVPSKICVTAIGYLHTRETWRGERWFPIDAPMRELRDAYDELTREGHLALEAIRAEALPPPPVPPDRDTRHLVLGTLFESDGELWLKTGPGSDGAWLQVTTAHEDQRAELVAYVKSRRVRGPSQGGDASNDASVGGEITHEQMQAIVDRMNGAARAVRTMQDKTVETMATGIQRLDE